MRYLARRRLEQASIRLLDPSENIGRIAYESGYESEAAFHRIQLCFMVLRRRPGGAT